jgi:hypothetical protein
MSFLIRRGAIPTAFPWYLTAPKYSLASEPNCCHQAFDHSGDEKIELAGELA